MHPHFATTTNSAYLPTYIMPLGDSTYSRLQIVWNSTSGLQAVGTCTALDRWCLVVWSLKTRSSLPTELTELFYRLGSDTCTRDVRHFINLFVCLINLTITLYILETYKMVNYQLTNLSICGHQCVKMRCNFKIVIKSAYSSFFSGKGDNRTMVLYIRVNHIVSKCFLLILCVWVQKSTEIPNRTHRPTFISAYDIGNDTYRTMLTL